MDNTELIKSDLRLRIRQIEHIMNKVRHIDRFGEFSDIKLFYYKLSDVKKEYESRFTPTGWAGISGIAGNDRLTRSVLTGYRFKSFVYEVRYESLAVNYDTRFFGFHHPEPFLLFGISSATVFNFGKISGGFQDEKYNKVLSDVHKDPSLILRERERVTAYLMRGCGTSVFKRNGESFPIDLTIPGGY